MPGRLLQTAAAAVVLTISVPVLTFAIFTTITALILVGVRAAVLSSEFWILAFVEAWTYSQPKKPASASPQRAVQNKQQGSIEFRSPSARSRTNSFVDSNSLKRLSQRSDSHVSLVGTPMNRDFEGVGGWRTSRGDDDDQSLWTNMKNRLDSRTRSSSRHHKRSVTGGSLHSTALNSPEFFPVAMRTPRQRPQTSGSASPQSYFNLHLPTSRSMVTLQPKRFSTSSSDKWNFAPHERPESLELEREAEQIALAI